MNMSVTPPEHRFAPASSLARRAGIGALVALTLALPAVVASAQQAYARMAVNLRAGPGTNYPVVATLGNGQPFSVAGCTSGYGWCDVVMPDGLRGWVYSDAIDYAYEDRRVPLAGYGAAIGIPIVTFALGSYWGNNYRDRSWYDDRRYWGGRPPPPREGWQRPPPSRPDWRPNAWQGPRPGERQGWQDRQGYRGPNRELVPFRAPNENEVRPQRDPGMRPGREGGMRPPQQQQPQQQMRPQQQQPQQQMRPPPQQQPQRGGPPDRGGQRELAPFQAPAK